ncbi:MAG: hypothetical protein ACRCX8_06570 [Sarcina sp.]
MKENINIEDVVEFIRKYGWKYDYIIEEELKKLNVITKEDVSKEISKNEDFYRKMADM